MPVATVGESPADDGSDVVAVVVDYDVGSLLPACVDSLRAEKVARIIVVENGDATAARAALGTAGQHAEVLAPGRNLGYGAGANRGAAAAPTASYLLVCNGDLRVHPGAVAALAAALDSDPSRAIVGPRILTVDGEVYPSVRRFPSLVDAAGHALLGPFRPDNRWSRRYRDGSGGGSGRRPGPVSAEPDVDWVSGSCFLARRQAFEELGGFDESYFMFAEDMDLCWRAHRTGWTVGSVPAAVVTHVQGVSTARHPYRMLWAHHRSAWRFVVRTTAGVRRLALPLAAAVLGSRFVLDVSRRLVGGARSR